MVADNLALILDSMLEALGSMRRWQRVRWSNSTPSNG